MAESAADRRSSPLPLPTFLSDFDQMLKPSSQLGSAVDLPGMFLRAEGGGNQERESDLRCFLRPDYPEVDESVSFSDTFKDVDMVFSLPNSFPIDADSTFNHHLSQTLESLELEHHGSYTTSAFEFQKNRSSVLLSSKTAPSKWDDAEKWIASPNSNKLGKISTTLIRRTAPGTSSRGNRQFSSKMMEISEESAIQLVNPVADNPVGQQSVNSTRSVSMKDTGTEMTPIASQETSRTGTPMREETPIRAPAPSRPSNQCSKPVDSVDLPEASRELTDKELQMRTRREIMALGTQLGKPNIAAWASKEEVNKSRSKSTPTAAVNSCEGPVKSIIEMRASAWEEAEKAKNVAVFKREEMQIQVWEDHHKAKIEAETRKIEVKVERMRASAHERLMARLAAARLKAEEKRLAAEARRNRRASRTSRQVDYIRRTGRVPLSFSLCWGCQC